MLFEQFEVKGLSHYSYAVGCQKAGRMAIVDPRRDIDVYLDFARGQKMEISDILETHIHADYASGARELAERSGGRLHLSGHDEGERYQVGFEHENLRDGESLTIGSVRVETLHTPGHTPEHISFLIFDVSRSSDVPLLLLSGDFLFVGSLGRPDLLGEEEKQDLANQMFDSVRRKLADLPDGLEVYPAHGAGSMCGSGMGGRGRSTLGFERLTNPYLNAKLSREGFVKQILESVPPFPDYYRRMKETNSAGPAILKGLPGKNSLPVDDFKDLVKSGHLVIDLRDQLAFGGSHIPGSFGIGAGDNLSTWAAWVVPYDQPLLLVPATPDQVEAAARALVRVGFDEVEGFLEGGIASWREAGFELQGTEQITVNRLYERLRKGSKIKVLDVRADGEWNEGHIEDAIHIMAGHLPKNLEKLPSAELAVICGSGYRSTVAASLLQRAGFEEIVNVTGGMTAWKKAGLPVQKSSS